AIHPDCPRPAVRAENRISKDLTGIRIVDLADSDVAGLAAHRISDDMRNALPLVCGEYGFVPALSFEASCLIDRKAGVVSDLDALTMVDIFMRQIAPLA